MSNIIKEAAKNVYSAAPPAGAPMKNYGAVMNPDGTTQNPRTTNQPVQQQQVQTPVKAPSADPVLSDVQQANVFKNRNLNGDHFITSRVGLGEDAKTESDDARMNAYKKIVAGDGQDGAPTQEANAAAKSWRGAVTDDERIEKQNRTRMMINAIGDTVKHLGNLYFTTKGATPMNLTSQTETQYAMQEAQRKEKEAKDKAASELSYKRSLDAVAQANKDRQFELDLAEFGIKKEAASRATEKDKADLAYKLQQVKNLVTEGRKKEADALISEIKSKYEEADRKASIDQKKAAAAKSRSGIAVDAARIGHIGLQNEKLKKEIKKEDSNGYSFPVWAAGSDGKMKYQDGYSYNSKYKNFHKNIASHLGNYLKSKGWIDDNAMTTGKEGINAIYAAAVKHADDPQVQRVLRQLTGGPTKTSEKTGTKSKTASSFGGKK